MINLIPPTAKRNITYTYWMRVITIWLFLLGTLSIMLTLLFLPTYVEIGNQVAALKQDVASSSAKTSSYDVSAAALLQANQQAQLVVDMPTTTTFFEYLSRLEQLAGVDVQIDTLQFDRHNPVGTIQVSGVAHTRQGLADFRDAVVADPKFLKADLPISSLIKERDLPFSMHIIMATTTASTTKP